RLRSLDVCTLLVADLTKCRCGAHLADHVPGLVRLADRLFQVLGCGAVLPDDTELEPESDQRLQLAGRVTGGPGQVEGVLVQLLRLAVLAQRTQVAVQRRRLPDGVVRWPWLAAWCAAASRLSISASSHRLPAAASRRPGSLRFHVSVSDPFEAGPMLTGGP